MFTKNQIPLILILIMMNCSNENSIPARPEIENELVPLSTVDASILQEIRYTGSNNFMGRPVNGYENVDDVPIQPSAAQALKKAQKELIDQRLSLLVFDAYRPQIAVDHFVEWSLQPEDTLMKAGYYPDFKKPELFEQGYIARESSHTTGYTVDLTLVDLSTGLELDMGSAFDFFGPVSHHGAPGLTPEQEQNRILLRSTLERSGFSAYEKEWWHYRFVPENE
jgi:D-alanyl-D-alanine dipeptidase